jgi:hypothetical protein
MPNPPPSAAAYPAMGVRVGYSDGNPLTTALLNQLAAYLVAQDGNGNIQQITCARIGPDAFVTADPSGSFWLTYNAYFDSGSMQWWPLNSGVACFAIEISASGISFAASPANTTPFAWKSIDSFNANGLASVLVIEGEIAVMAAQIAGLMASLANAGTPIFANTTAAQASILANGSYYYTISQSAGGALDLYLKNSGASSSLLATLPSLSSALNTPSSLQSASQTAMTLSLSEPFGTQYASTAYAQSSRLRAGRDARRVRLQPGDPRPDGFRFRQHDDLWRARGDAGEPASTLREEVVACRLVSDVKIIFSRATWDGAHRFRHPES